MPKNWHFWGILGVKVLTYLGTKIGLYFMTYTVLTVKLCHLGTVSSAFRSRIGVGFVGVESQSLSVP